MRVTSVLIGLCLALAVCSCGPRTETVKQTYADGKPQLEFSVYRDENGTMRRHGDLKEWYRNGNLKKKQHYRRGFRDGVLEEYSEHGLPTHKATYKDGQRHGVDVQYDENGEPACVAEYSDGKLHGTRQVFYPGGKRSVTFYEDGKEGIWILYDADGNALESKQPQ